MALTAQPKFGGHLRWHRERGEWTQDEIARSIGVGRELLSRWENDHQVPSLHHAVALARRYRLSLDVLLGIDPTNGK